MRRKFAELYNYIIQEFYEECLVSAEEREQLSFKIGQDSVITKEPKKEKKSTLFKQSKKASNDKKKKNEIDSTTSATASSDAKKQNQLVMIKHQKVKMIPSLWDGLNVTCIVFTI